MTLKNIVFQSTPSLKRYFQHHIIENIAKHVFKGEKALRFLKNSLGTCFFSIYSPIAVALHSEKVVFLTSFPRWLPGKHPFSRPTPRKRLFSPSEALFRPPEALFHLQRPFFHLISLISSFPESDGGHYEILKRTSNNSENINRNVFIQL